MLLWVKMLLICCGYSTSLVWHSWSLFGVQRGYKRIWTFSWFFFFPLSLKRMNQKLWHCWQPHVKILKLSIKGQPTIFNFFSVHFTRFNAILKKLRRSLSRCLPSQTPVHLANICVFYTFTVSLDCLEWSSHLNSCISEWKEQRARLVQDMMSESRVETLNVLAPLCKKKLQAITHHTAASQAKKRK